MNDAARLAAAGLVPISFEAPPADRGCPGRRQKSGARYPFCVIECSRIDKPGPQLAPALRIVGESVSGKLESYPKCINHMEHAPHEAGAVSRDASVSGETAAVCAEGLHATQCAPAVAGLTSQDLGPPSWGRTALTESAR